MGRVPKRRFKSSGKATSHKAREERGIHVVYSARGKNLLSNRINTGKRTSPEKSEKGKERGDEWGRAPLTDLKRFYNRKGLPPSDPYHDARGQRSRCHERSGPEIKGFSSVMEKPSDQGSRKADTRGGQEEDSHSERERM